MSALDVTLVASIGKIPRLFLILCLLSPMTSFADLLIGTNGERFVGKVIEELTNAVVFESETASRLVAPRSRTQELQRKPGTTRVAARPTHRNYSRRQARNCLI